MAIVTMIKASENYGSWAVLTRTNAELNTIASFIKKAGIPCDTFKQGQLKFEELEEKMAQNTVKLLTVHSAKGLEWDNVVVIGVRFQPEEERNVCYVAATRARNNLYWMVKQKKTMRRW